MTTRNSSKPATTNNRKRKPTTPPEIVSLNGAPADAPQDASQAPQDAPQAAPTTDKAARMAALKAALQAKLRAAEKSPSQAGPSRKGREAMRARWSDDVEQAAAAAAVRLPGRFPARGNGWTAAIELGVSAAFCSAPPKGANPDREVRAGDIALQMIDLCASDLRVRPLSLVELMESVEAARLLCDAEEASQPDWLDHIAVSDNQRKTEGLGLQTCLLYQLAKRLGKPVALTCDGEIRVVTLKKRLA